MRFWRTLWVRVTAYALAGILTAALAALGNHFLPGKAPIDIGNDAIDSLLTIIATSMLAVTTFSVGALISAYSGATSNATPRATPLLTENQVVQNSLATFVGSFSFSIVGIVALKVGAYGAEGRAVLFIVTLVIILLIVIALLRWINQLTSLGRVSNTVTLIEEATRQAMETRLNHPFLGGREAGEARSGRAVRSTRVGYVQFVDVAAMIDICERSDFEVDIAVLPGAFVHENMVLATICSKTRDASDDDVTAIRDMFAISVGRSFDQDPRFGLVVLTEVALRALSPGINDPGTAIDVIGRQTRLLTFWSGAWERACRDCAGNPRVSAPPLHHADMLEDAFNVIGRDAAGQVDVVLRLIKALQALGETGPEAFRHAARHQLDILIERAARRIQSADDRKRIEACLKGARRLPPLPE